MELIKINDTQKENVEFFLKDYKYIYLCNECGSIYGTDLKEKKEIKLCPHCESELKKIKKKK